jgi:hypothetical protein
MRTPLVALVAALCLVVGVADAAARVGSSPKAKFVARAEAYCTRAKADFDALPPFPFKNFDPLHPDPKVLPKVGRYFAGAGNGIPIARRLDRQLRGIGNPPSDGPAWRTVLATFHEFIAVIQREHATALRADVGGWVKAVRENRLMPDRLTSAAKAFGAKRCAIFD